MVPVEQIVDGDLPVALDHELLNAGHDFHISAEGDGIEAESPGGSEEFFQRWRGRVMGAKYEPLVVRYLRDRRQPVPRFIEFSIIEDVQTGYAIEAAVDSI